MERVFSLQLLTEEESESFSCLEDAAAGVVLVSVTVVTKI